MSEHSPEAELRREIERLKTELARANIRRAKADTKAVDLRIQIEAMREECDRLEYEN